MFFAVFCDQKQVFMCCFGGLLYVFVVIGDDDFIRVFIKNS